MSNYTTELRFICENEYNGESSGFNEINKILTTVAPKIFNFDFPIFDEEYRLPLEVKILRTYYTREICEETVGLWKLRLQTKLCNIMPYYNQLYKSALLEFDVFADVDYTEVNDGSTHDNLQKIINFQNLGGVDTNTYTKNGKEKSTTNYRSGTPSPALIASISKALRLAYVDIDKKYEYVHKLNQHLKDELSKYENVYINSNDKSIPHILNISVIGVKPETMLHALEKYDIFISTQSACSSSNTKSMAVFNLTHDEKRSESSIRISISSVTTEKEIEYFIKSFDECYNSLLRG